MHGPAVQWVRRSDMGSAEPRGNTKANAFECNMVETNQVPPMKERPVSGVTQTYTNLKGGGATSVLHKNYSK